MNIIFTQLAAINDYAQLAIQELDIPVNKAIKDPVKQEKWAEQKRAKMLEEGLRRAVTSQIYAIGLAVSLKSSEDNSKYQNVVYIGEEREILLKLKSGVIRALEVDSQINLIMKNMKNFGFPFLLRRFIACDINPSILYPSNNLKHLDINHYYQTYSSACPEFTSLTEDMALLNQGRSQQLKLPDIDIKDLYIQWNNIGNVMAKEAIINYLQRKLEVLVTYYNAFTSGKEEREGLGQNGF